MNARERSALRADISGSALAAVPAAPAGTGVRRMNHTAGSSTAQAPRPITICAVRQPCCETSQPANGAIVIGATPMPADTSDTARLRCLSNDAAVAAITGAKNAPAATPISRPKHS